MLRVSAGREAEKPQPRCFDASPLKLIQLLIGLNGFNGFNFLFDGGEKPPLVVPHLGHKLSGSVNPLIYCAEIRSGNEFSRDSGRRQMETLAANHLNFSTFLFFCFVLYFLSPLLLLLLLLRSLLILLDISIFVLLVSVFFIHLFADDDVLLS